jgi:urocanate hydratase
MANEVMRRSMLAGLVVDPLPEPESELDARVPHAPRCPLILSAQDAAVAVANALRYFPASVHGVLAPEFARELREWGHIYMRRFRPRDWEMRAYPLAAYPARTAAGAALLLMICNNLDPRVAQFPHELVTYGGTGHVFNNWAQFRIACRLLCEMSDEQTLVMCSGHPAGLFPSPREAPRAVLTNGMVVGNYSDRETFERLRAMSVTMYGQMTAGSYCYIGPQGIVHGTTLTILNAGRKYLHGCEDLRGKLFVTSGLGGMSGAQGKAARVCGAIALIAEVSRAAIDKRKAQGWVDEVFEEGELGRCIARVREARARKESVAIAWHGNVVSLWERFASPECDVVPELGSDQTSLHNPYFGGYYPLGATFAEANTMMAAEPARFKALVDETLRRHVAAVNAVAARGMQFWDYGNSFLLAASRVGADVFALQDPAAAAFGADWQPGLLIAPTR